MGTPWNNIAGLDIMILIYVIIWNPTDSWTWFWAPRCSYQHAHMGTNFLKKISSDILHHILFQALKYNCVMYYYGSSIFSFSWNVKHWKYASEKFLYLLIIFYMLRGGREFYLISCSDAVAGRQDLKGWPNLSSFLTEIR